MILSDFLFTNNTIQLKVVAHDWKHAVKIGTDLLENKHYITSEYYEDIINQVEKLGPYFLIAPGLALPHTGPDKGVLKSGWALITLETPINFGDKYNDPIDILITLASASSKEHSAQGVMQVVEIFDIPELVTAIRQSRTIDDLKKAFQTHYPQGNV